MADGSDRIERPLPQPARRLSTTLARRGTLVPAGRMRRRDGSHLRRQEFTGALMMLVAIYATTWWATHRPLWALLVSGMLGAVMFWPSRRRRRRAVSGAPPAAAARPGSDRSPARP